MAADTHEARFGAMGSNAHVIVTGASQLVERARERLDELERAWSRFIDTSEVSRLNARAGTAVTVTRDTFELVRRAVQAWRQTGGRFDPTVLGDVVRAGYDRPFAALAGATHSRAGVSSLARGCAGITLDARLRTVALRAGTGFDPGGIGKGLAADMVVEELLRAGAVGACVNLGGDLRAGGRGPDDGRWVIAVDHPVAETPVAVVALAAGAVATSTIAKRTWIVDGQRRHHLIDPSTGSSARSPIVSVTAVTGEAWWAEAAAKAALLVEADPVGTMTAAVERLEALSCEGVVVAENGAIAMTAHVGDFMVEMAP